jgi:hypothetical protein
MGTRPQARADDVSFFKTRTHPRGCLVPRCQRETQAMVICPSHWNHLPRRLSDAAWRSYETGYLDGTHPNNEYKHWLRECLAWIEENVEDERPKRILASWR